MEAANDFSKVKQGVCVRVWNWNLKMYVLYFCALPFNIFYLLYPVVTPILVMGITVWSLII